MAMHKANDRLCNANTACTAPAYNEHPVATLYKQGAPVVLTGGQFPLPATSTSPQLTLGHNPGQVTFLPYDFNPPSVTLVGSRMRKSTELSLLPRLDGETLAAGNICPMAHLPFVSLYPIYRFL